MMACLRNTLHHALRQLGAWFALLCVGCVAVSQARAEASTVPTVLRVAELAPGVFVQIGALEVWSRSNAGNVSNLGFIVGSRCVAVIDSGGSPEVGRRLRATIARTTALPVCYVINTHAHPDHVLGNVALAASGAEAPKFVASKRLTPALSARERNYLTAVRRDLEVPMAHESIIYPSVLVDTTMDLDLGDRVLGLRAWPTAHTDNDLTVYDRKTRTLFLGDLLFVDHIPVIDGSLRGWLAVMIDLKGQDVAFAVPGHGAAGADWPGMMAHQEAYLRSVLDETRAAIRAHRTISQAVEQVATEASAGWLLADHFHRRNITAAYAELEWE